MAMKKYMGFRPEFWQSGPSRPLPIVDIAGTMFRVDINKREFREVGNPYNRMPFGDIKEEHGFRVLLFDTRVKNEYVNRETKPGQLPDHVQIVIIPPLKELDPVGLARLHGFSDEYYIQRQPADCQKTPTVATQENKRSERKEKKGPSM
jgi:hypothetical protein